METRTFRKPVAQRLTGKPAAIAASYLRPGYPAPGTVPLHGVTSGAGAMRMNERGAMPAAYKEKP